MKKLNAKELERKYLESPNTCPFCGSTDIEADHGEFDHDLGFRNIECNGCNKNWVEEFKMSSVTFNADDMTEEACEQYDPTELHYRDTGGTDGG